MEKEELAMYILEVKYIEIHEGEVSDESFLFPYGWKKIRDREVKTKMLVEALQKGIFLHQTEEYEEFCRRTTERLHN